MKIKERIRETCFWYKVIAKANMILGQILLEIMPTQILLVHEHNSICLAFVFAAPRKSEFIRY